MPVTDVMQKNHRECDELFAVAETAVSNQDWDAATQAWNRFTTELETHLTDKEEGKLFPAFEAVNGPMGPTQIMRGEHQQMRALVAQMNEVLSSKNDQQFLGLADTLMMLMQQHNMKEEQILYPMIDMRVANATDLLQ
jgi:iron-sulfur cluster repair protein YtfE (RIC family)